MDKKTELRIFNKWFANKVKQDIKAAKNRRHIDEVLRNGRPITFRYEY